MRQGSYGSGSQYKDAKVNFWVLALYSEGPKNTCHYYTWQRQQFLSKCQLLPLLKSLDTTMIPNSDEDNNMRKTQKSMIDKKYLHLLVVMHPLKYLLTLTFYFPLLYQVYHRCQSLLDSPHHPGRWRKTINHDKFLQRRV